MVMGVAMRAIINNAIHLTKYSPTFVLIVCAMNYVHYQNQSIMAFRVFALVMACAVMAQAMPISSELAKARAAAADESKKDPCNGDDYGTAGQFDFYGMWCVVWWRAVPEINCSCDDVMM